MISALIALFVVFAAVQALILTSVSDKLSGAGRPRRAETRGYWLSQTAVMPE